MRAVLRRHWPEYLIEAAGLGTFMVSACAFGTLLGHPASPAVAALPDPLARRVLMGLAMGLTAVGLIASPWGQRSGAHFNPATTLTFWRLGKVAPTDAVCYAAAQTAGGLAGVLLAAAALGSLLADPEVRYVEAPLSGMSMNPARSLASALPAGAWAVLWIYVVAPPLGMLLAAEAYVRRRGTAAVFCAKLHHDNAQPCIFACRFDELRKGVPA